MQVHFSVPESCFHWPHLAGDVLLFDDVAVLYKRAGDLIMVVTGSQDENELILTAVLSGVSEALTILLRCDNPPASVILADIETHVAFNYSLPCQHKRLHLRIRQSNDGFNTGPRGHRAGGFAGMLSTRSQFWRI